ncbi:MAG: AsmA family protein [Hyphomicrobiaceae bacterium]
MHRILLAIGGLLVGLLAALFIAPVFIDWNRYRGVLEEEATRLLGREVRVGGRIGIQFLPTPSLSVQQIRLADTQALVGTPLFRAQSVTMGLAIGPLFRGDVQVTHVEMRKPELTLVLDGKGGGNWSTFADRKLQAVLAPSSIILDDVRFTEGVVAILERDGRERTRIERIAGHLSAADLEGPYRVAASFDYRGTVGEMKLGTARADADGAVRLKAAVTIPGARQTLSFDGVARDVLSRPHMQGLVKARIDQGAKPEAANAADTAFEIGGQLTADTSGALLRALTVSFERAGRPQLASGEARMVWGGKPSLDVGLQSRWIDFDSLGLSPPGTPLATRGQAFADALRGALPADGAVRVRVNLDQATFGGEIISVVDLAMTRETGPPVVTMSALLPGGSRIHLGGTLDAEKDRTRFAGKLSLGGASLRRFLVWSMATKTPVIGADGAFSLDGSISLGAGRYAVEGMTARLAGSEVRGSLAWSEVQARRNVSISLAGAELDLDGLLAEAPTLDSLRAHLFDSITSAPGQRLADAVTLRLDLGKLQLAGLALRDVQAAIDIAEGKLAVSRLIAEGPEGWSIDGRCDLDRGPGGRLQGNAAMALSAASPAGVAALARAAGLTSPWLPAADRVGRALPLQLSTRVKLEGAETSRATVSIDGMLGRTHIAASTRMSGLDAAWRDRATDLAMTLTGRDGTALADLLGTGPRQAAGKATDPARIVLRGIGKPGSGLETLLAAETAGNALEYRGRIAVSETAQVVADGQVEMALGDAGRMLAALGLPFEGALARRPARGALKLSRNPSRLLLEGGELAIAETPTRLALEFTPNDAGSTLTGSVTSRTASLPAILDALTSARTRRGDTAADRSLWSDDPFDLAQFADLSVDVEVDAAALDIGGGVLIHEPKAHLVAKAGRVTLSLTSNKLLDGALKGEIRLTEAPVGAAAEVDVSIRGARIEALFPKESEAAAKGVLSTNLHLAGQALGPRGLIAALRGTGGLDLGAGEMHRLSPEAIARATETILGKAGELSPEDVRQRLLAALAHGTMPIPRGRIGVEVADGVIRLAPLSLVSGHGRTTGTWTIDLESMRYDAEWRIAPASGSGETGRAKAGRPLPAIVVVYTGPLSAVARAEPRLQSEDFERELVVRKMERDLAELERLRKLDEERARQEIERQRRLELERQRQQNEERLRLERERANALQPGTVEPQRAAPLPPRNRTDLAPNAPGPGLQPSLPALPTAVPNLR